MLCVKVYIRQGKTRTWLHSIELVLWAKKNKKKINKFGTTRTRLSI